jgi:RNA-binding protein
MKQKKLSNKQIRYLRGLGHHLSPVAMVGQNGITDKVLASIDEALSVHELIKIKIQDGASANRQESATSIATKTGAALVQLLGRKVLIFRHNKDIKKDKRISLP